MRRQSREDRNQHSQQHSRRETSRAEPSPILLYSSQVALTYWQCKAAGQPWGYCSSAGRRDKSRVFLLATFSNAANKQDFSAILFPQKSLMPQWIEVFSAKGHRAWWKDLCSHTTKGSRMRMLGQLVHFEKGLQITELLQHSSQQTHKAARGDHYSKYTAKAEQRVVLLKKKVHY